MPSYAQMYAICVPHSWRMRVRLVAISLTHGSGVGAWKGFPERFVWGAATAAYQIEGAVHRGRSRAVDLGHLHATPPGKVAGGETGDVACDHYHRWRRGPRSARRGRLGRLPVLGRLAAHPADRRRAGEPARPRLLPAPGRRAARARASPRSSRCTTGICRRRWRTPAAGGPGTPRPGSPTTPRSWPARWPTFDPYWITLNEPFCSAIVGYAEGRHAPGRARGSWRARRRPPPAARPRPGRAGAAGRRRAPGSGSR